MADRITTTGTISCSQDEEQTRTARAQYHTKNNDIIMTCHSLKPEGKVLTGHSSGHHSSSPRQSQKLVGCARFCDPQITF